MKKYLILAVLPFLMGCPFEPGETQSVPPPDAPLDPGDAASLADPPVLTQTEPAGLATVCQKREAACVPGSACYSFKSCYEDVQGNSSAILACVMANPTGAKRWAKVVACVCQGMPADPSAETFCIGKYGHPHG